MNLKNRKNPLVKEKENLVCNEQILRSPSFNKSSHKKCKSQNSLKNSLIKIQKSKNVLNNFTFSK